MSLLIVIVLLSCAACSNAYVSASVPCLGMLWKRQRALRVFGAHFKPPVALAYRCRVFCLLYVSKPGLRITNNVAHKTPVVNQLLLPFVCLFPSHFELGKFKGTQPATALPLYVILLMLYTLASTLDKQRQIASCTSQRPGPPVAVVKRCHGLCCTTSAAMQVGSGP